MTAAIVNIDRGTVMIKQEAKKHLEEVIIPFWKSLRDDVNGGYTGFVDFDLNKHGKEVKGCILHSRILWFFSNAYMALKDESLLDEANHAYEFLDKYCFDKEFGGIYWSVTYDGKPYEDLKHTYNQAFAIYALSSYYAATGKKQALDKAYELYKLIETKCSDDRGYLEALTRKFEICGNDKLSENGVMADRTMNTLLHVFEAYTELYRVDGDERVADSLRIIFDRFADKMYNPKLHRQEVFFDNDYNSLIDLTSYGHDIETSWLMDRGLAILNDSEYTAKIKPITRALADNILKVAFDGHSLYNECERGVVNTSRIWWVQAETVIGFINAYEERPERTDFKEAALSEWEYIKDKLVDKRKGSEWYWEVDKDGNPTSRKPIVEPWKCPYHNGRMCIEIMNRSVD